jgi:uncharacterized protein (DUF1778 family)
MSDHNPSVIRLTAEESARLHEILLNPPKPSETLKRAVRDGVRMAREIERDGVVRVELEVKE